MMTPRHFPSGWLCGLLMLMSKSASVSAQATASVDEVRKPGPSTLASRQSAKVDAILSEWNKPDSPGCVVGVIRDGELVYHRGFGMANLEHGAPITEKTVFNVASMSKQFTALATLLLASDGMLTLDDDVRRFIPQLPVYFEDTPMRIRHLLGHTSGLRDYLGLLQLMGIDKRKDFFGKEEARDLICRQMGLTSKPGETYQYTDTGYFLLGLIVERVSGTSLGKFCDQRIFGPLGMKRTLFRGDRARVISGRAQGYRPTANGSFRMDEVNAPEAHVGPGGLWTTLEDLLLWDRNFYHPIVGGEDVIRTLRTSLVTLPGDRAQYGCGLLLRRFRGLPAEEHAGSEPGFGANMMRFPNHGVSLVVLCNRKGINPMRLSLAIADVYLHDRFSDTEDALADPVDIYSSEGHKERTLGTSPSRPIDELEATYYQVGGNGTIQIQRSGSGLTAHLKRDFWHAKCRLTPLQDGRFRAEDAPPWLKVVEFKSADDRFASYCDLFLEGGADPVRFVAIPPLTTAEATALSGQYHSPELAVTYEAVIEASRLSFRLADRPRIRVFDRLARIAQDRFLRGGDTGLELRRDAEGNIIGLTLFTERGIRIGFDRIGTVDANVK